jgi:hypothetical protein
MTAPCAIPWCEREVVSEIDGETVHLSAIQRAEGTSVSLYQTPILGTRLIVHTLTVPVGSAGHHEDVARLLANLGHSELAALVASTAAMAGDLP